MSKCAIIDFRTEDKVIDSLYKYFDKVIPSAKLNVNPSICGHSDLGMCKLDDGKAVVCPSAYEYYKNELPGIEIICGSSEPEEKYPEDVFYNAACENGIAIHNFKFTDKITLAQIEQKFLKCINVHQGYSKCSICYTGSNGIITDDEGIYKTLKKDGFDVLKINKGKVILNGMNYGFFGGATGYFENKIFVTGQIKNLDEYKTIKKFLIKHDTEVIEINKGLITDVGSIICFSSKI